MKTIERYVFGAFLTSFFLAFLVLSFVLTVGLMVQIVGYMLQGIPVDLVCAIKNFNGLKFILPDYVDPATGFISHKSKDGKELKASQRTPDKTRKTYLNVMMSNGLQAACNAPLQ